MAQSVVVPSHVQTALSVGLIAASSITEQALMRDREPVSVLLPTVEWNVACDQLAAQLAPEDELLVICDTEEDPVAHHDPPEAVRVLVAGEPEGCSGKANALAYGMERAVNDRFVWTDDDFDRDADWLDRLVTAGEAHGPATAIPFFGGRGWWRLLEPWYGALFTCLVYLQVGGAADIAWGGGVTFTRSELTVSSSEFVAELRTVLSDDYLLTRRLSEVHAIRSMIAHVEVPGTFDEVRHRALRFGRIVAVNSGWSPWLKLSGMLAVGSLLSPVLAVLSLTLGFAIIYAWLGLRRANFLLASAGVLLLPLVTAATAVSREFEWGGRRYRYVRPRGVEVLESASDS